MKKVIFTILLLLGTTVTYVQAQDTEEDYSFPVNYKGQEPTIVDFVSAILGQEFIGESLGEMEDNWKKYLRGKKLPPGRSFIVDTENGYMHYDADFVEEKECHFSQYIEYRHWDCTDGQHELVAENTVNFRDGKPFAGQFSGLTFYLYDNETRKMEFCYASILGLSDIDMPWDTNLIVNSLPRIGKTIEYTFYTPSGKQTTTRMIWNGTTFVPETQANTFYRPIPMILDSDFGSSTDDLFALMMLHHYIDEGRVDLKGIVVDREGLKNAELVDIFNTYYGHPQIPVGLERNGVKNPRCFIPYNGICDLKDDNGEPLFKRTHDMSQCPDGYKLYRQLLSQAEDKSIVIVAIGFVTSLAELFESGADEYSPLSGQDLFEQKVKSVYIQSGRFESGDSLCGYNMRAASHQSAIFYEKLPKNVDLIMSPSNIGDIMNYPPQDVLVDLSYTETNPIKSVYTNYTCDTGQRMWDTNCLVNAVLGDDKYNLSPRGWVTFVDKGEESLMLFRQDPEGNARYQLPGDSYFGEEKLMDIRRHNRINKYPAPYTIEAPQPQLIRKDAAEWVKPRLQQLVDKYMGSAGNNLDPDDVRSLFRPLGYTGPNFVDYQEAEQLLTDAIYSQMLQKALRAGKKDLVIVTGPPASGKSTAAHELNLRKAGLIYDAALTEAGRLEEVITQAKKAGMEKITVVPVYNDVLTCYKNAVNRGKRTWRYTAMDYMISSFRNSIGQMEKLRQEFPDVEILPVDCSHNQGVHRVSIKDAEKWKYNVTEEEMTALFTYLLNEINSGEIEASSVPAATGHILEIPNMSEKNTALARQIDQRVQEIMKEYQLRY